MEIGSCANQVVGADLEAKMTALAALGYDFIEPAWREENLPELGEAFGAKLRALGERTGCPVRSAILGTYSGLGERLPSPELRAEALDVLTRACATLAAAGGDVLLLPTWVGANPPEYDALYTSFLRDASAQAAPYGIKLATEHIVSSKYRNRAIGLYELAEKVDRENVGVYFDITNSLAAGEEPVEVARTIAPRLIQFHVKDYRRAGKSLAETPIREVKAVLDAAGYKGRAATEIDPFEENGQRTNAHLASALAVLRQNGY